jgi:hypothetical protein
MGHELLGIFLVVGFVCVSPCSYTLEVVDVS